MKALEDYTVDELKQALAARELDTKKNRATNEGAMKKKLAAFLKKYKKEIDRYIRKPPPITVEWSPGVTISLSIEMYSWFDSDDLPIYILNDGIVEVATGDKRIDDLFHIAFEGFESSFFEDDLGAVGRKQVKQKLAAFAKEAKDFLAICVAFNEENQDYLGDYGMIHALEGEDLD